MPQRRFRFIASDNSRPRSNLDVPAVSQLLKQLKSSYKNVRSNHKQLFAEMHLLERVYYKGKNQHGLSLFWRSVVSTRRMSLRIYETNVTGLLELLAGMFHDEAFGGTKVFSGAWTRIPPSDNIAKVLERLLGVASLLKAATMSFQKAYRALCLFMSTTAFLQLTVVLMSIVARMNAIASSLLEHLSSIIPRTYSVFESLESPGSLQRRISKLFEKFSVVAPVHSLEDTIAQESIAPTYTGDEDLGSTIVRSTQPTTIQTLIPITPASPRAIITPESPTPSIVDTVLETVMPRSPSPSLNALVSSQPIENVSAEALGRSEIVPSDVGEAVVTPKGVKKIKKRRRVRNEIDDIFG